MASARAPATVLLIRAISYTEIVPLSFPRAIAIGLYRRRPSTNACLLIDIFTDIHNHQKARTVVLARL
jgi:hypothetical protein